MFTKKHLLAGLVALATLVSINATAGFNSLDNDRMTRPEARRIVEKYYNAFLLRSSEQEGRRFWIRTLRREGYNFLPEMAFHFCNSEEFHNSTLHTYRPRRIVRNAQNVLRLASSQSTTQRYTKMMRRQKNTGGQQGARACREMGRDFLWSL